jgi:adenylate cyclase
MTGLVFRNHGTLDKFEGDAVMAFWGAPIHQEDHALRACRTALEMQDQLARIREQWFAQGRPALHTRIGVNTGEMVVGNMGASGRFDYTVIGDSVNLASRLEGANKTYRTGILVSERTYDLVRSNMVGRELDLITVKGRSEPLKIYELVCLRDGETEEKHHPFLEEYERALHLYRRRDWKGAEQAFSEVLLRRPGDGPSLLYRERCTVYAATPPPADWNGVFAMTSK